MTIETILMAGIASLAVVVTALWRSDIKNRDKETARLASALEDAIGRIRALEESRLTAAVQRGDEMKALAERFVRELADNSAIMRGLKDSFEVFSAAFSGRPCMHDLGTQALEPRPATGAISKERHR